MEARSRHCARREERGLEPLGVSWGHITRELAANSNLVLRNCISHTAEFKFFFFSPSLWYKPWRPHTMQTTPWGTTSTNTSLNGHVRLTQGVGLERGRRRGRGPSHPARTPTRKRGGCDIRQALVNYELGREPIDRAPEENVRGETV